MLYKIIEINVELVYDKLLYKAALFLILTFVVADFMSCHQTALMRCL